MFTPFVGSGLSLYCIESWEFKIIIAKSLSSVEQIFDIVGDLAGLDGTLRLAVGRPQFRTLLLCQMGHCYFLEVLTQVEAWERRLGTDQGAHQGWDVPRFQPHGL
jgi:hypothetical protein